MGPYKPLRNWVDEFPIPYYMEMSWELSLDPITHLNKIMRCWFVQLGIVAPKEKGVYRRLTIQKNV